MKKTQFYFIFLVFMVFELTIFFSYQISGSGALMLLMVVGVILYYSMLIDIYMKSKKSEVIQ